MSVQRKQRLIHAVEMLAGVTVLCAGVTLGIIAGLGQTTSTAAASAIAGAAGIKVGTASFYLYGVFFLLQLLMLRSKFEWERCFQLLPILAHGVLLNFFRYRFAPFQYLAPQGYLQQMLCFLCGMGLISLGFTITKNCNFTNYPAEAFCALVAERVRMRYGTCKIFLDFAYVIFALLICWRACSDGLISPAASTLYMQRSGLLLAVPAGGGPLYIFLDYPKFGGNFYDAKKP